MIIALPFLLGFGSAAAGQPVEPTVGTVYVTEVSDTVPKVAARYHVPAREVAQANDLGIYERLPLDMGLIVPLRPKDVIWPRPVTSVTITPTQIIQGDSVLLTINASQPVSVSSQVSDLTLRFTPAGQHVWGLMPFDPFAAPGRHWLHLKIQSEQGIADLPIALDVKPMDYYTQELDLTDDKTNLLDPGLRAYENRRLSSIWNQFTPTKLWQGNFRLPLKSDWYKTTDFGTRRSYNGGPVNSYHEGVDMAYSAGTPVYAPAEGIVVLAEPLAVRGNAVIIDHGMGLHSGYWHLSEIKAQLGQAVKPGDLLGLMGTTGLSTGPHLHWETRVSFVPVNPMQWLDFKIQ